MSNRGFNLIELNPYFPRPYVFSEAAICLQDSIRESGFECEYHANKPGSHQWSIILGANDGSPYLDFLPPERSILFNFEPLASSSPLVTEKYLDLLRRYPTFDYHQKNIEYLANYSHTDVDLAHFEIPIVPSNNLLFQSSQGIEKDIDVLFFGTPNKRRQKIIDQLRDAGLVVELVSGSYGFELAPVILRARLVLHISFYETNLVTPLRFLQPIIQGTPIVSEEAFQSQYCDWTNSGIHFSEYRNIVADCLSLLKDEFRCESYHMLNNQFVAKIKFAEAFKFALEDLKVFDR